jgi:hypothetical protein
MTLPRRKVLATKEIAFARWIQAIADGFILLAFCILFAPNKALSFNLHGFIILMSLSIWILKARSIGVS